MIFKTIKIILLFTGTFSIVQMTAAADEKNDIQYTFSKTDSTLSFRGSFKTNKSPDCILEIFLSYEHIKALAPDAKEIRLIDQGSNWNRIRYVYQKFIFFENISEWYRKLDIEKQRLDFILISSENNHATIPRMISSSGYYQLKKQGKELTVEYFQQCYLTKSSITDIYLNTVKNEAIHFMEQLLKYSTMICSN